jgi:uncharacterized protein YmfQ (DUF2313 family)
LKQLTSASEFPEVRYQHELARAPISAWQEMQAMRNGRSGVSGKTVRQRFESVQAVMEVKPSNALSFFTTPEAIGLVIGDRMASRPNVGLKRTKLIYKSQRLRIFSALSLTQLRSDRTRTSGGGLAAAIA